MLMQTDPIKKVIHHKYILIDHNYKRATLKFIKIFLK